MSDPALASLDDLETRMGSVSDEARALALLDDASALIRAEANYTWIDADGDGCVRIPLQHAEEVLALAGQVREKEADIFALYDSPDFSFAAWKASLG